ncbi:MAG: hypothetical protein ABEK16_00545 [Candidatus Nanohalobium sp.]
MNSQEWEDVYSASYYSYSQNQTPYFLRNDNLGVFNVMPYGEEVNIVESTDSPVVSDVASQARARGFQVGEVTMVENANLELAPDSPERLVVVPRDYPAAAVAAAPYARVTDSWVLIAGEDNVERVEQLMQEASRSVMIGDFGRVLSNNLGDEADEKILSPSKFNLSVQVAKAYLERKDSKKVRVASGNFISRSIVRGKSPVLLTGTNYLPDVTRKFLFEEPSHNISTAIMIGNEMTSVGEDIRKYNFTRNNRTTDEKMTVFVKYGQARGDSSQIYAISLFPLPTGDISLSIPRVTYNPESGEVLITYRNTGESRMYELTSFEVVSDGEVVATGSDMNPVFIGGNSNRTVSYDTNISQSVRDAYVEFSTTYGASPQQLDTYLTEAGQFSPPLRKNLTIKQITDSSNMSVESVKYFKGLDRFKVKIVNHRSQEGFAQVRLTDVMVTGETQSFGSERKKVPGDSSQTFYMPAELDRIDLGQNQRVNTVLSYGEERNLLVKTSTSSRELKVVERTITPVMIGVAAILLILIGGAFLAYRRLDIEIEVNS